MASLASQVARVERQVATALSLIDSLPGLQGVSRHYIAELIVIRVFAMLESVIEESACRLVCGAPYCDGTTPTLLRPQPTRGFDRARAAMQDYNRETSRKYLRWNKPAEISENLEYLLPTTEHFLMTLRSHGLLISELRKVRNHIAHGTRSTGAKFQEVVARYYGAKVPGLMPGQMLLSQRFTPSLAEKWCRETRVVLKAALRA